jgi:hypothetical protein
MLKNVQNDQDLNQEIEKITLRFKQTIIKSKPKFIVNPITYVDGQESGESSDESYHSSDEEYFDDLDCSDKETLPYRTSTKTRTTKNPYKEYSFAKKVGIVKVDSEKNKELVKLETFNSK